MKASKITERILNVLIYAVPCIIAVLALIYAFSGGVTESEAEKRGAMLFCECMDQEYDDHNRIISNNDTNEAKVFCTSKNLVSIYEGEFKEEPTEWNEELLLTFWSQNISSYSHDINEDSGEMIFKCNGEVIERADMNSSLSRVFTE